MSPKAKGDRAKKVLSPKERFLRRLQIFGIVLCGFPIAGTLWVAGKAAEADAPVDEAHMASPDDTSSRPFEVIAWSMGTFAIGLVGLGIIVYANLALASFAERKHDGEPKTGAVV